MIIALFLIALNSAIFIYYKNHCKKCKSILYTKLSKVLLNYLGTLIVVIIDLINSILVFKDFGWNKFFGRLIYAGVSASRIGLGLSNLIIVQKNYNKTTTWENCGNFKGWMKFWLITNYIGFVFSSFSRIYVGKYVISDL